MYFWALDSNAGMGLLIYIILLETVLGGLDQAPKQPAQEFKSRFWRTNGMHFSSQEIRYTSFS